MLGAAHGAEGLALRAGVHTGEAVVTIGATGMGMVAGDLVNTASRLQSVAPAGTVLVGEGTRRAADTAIEFEAAGEQELKGKVSPVPAFRALARGRAARRRWSQRGAGAAVRGPSVRAAAHQGLLPRDSAGARAEAGERHWPGRHRQDAAGLGVPEVHRRRHRDRRTGTRAGRRRTGRASASGRWARWSGCGSASAKGADEATTRDRLAASLEEFVPDADERRSLTDPLLHLLGIGESTTRERGQLFVAWRTFFERIAERAPVIMVFEDLQWADDGLLDFIEELVTWSRGQVDLPHHPRPCGSARPPSDLGRRTAQLHIACRWHRCRTTRSPACLPGLVPGLPDDVLRSDRRTRRGHPSLRRRDGAHAAERRLESSADGATFRPVGDLSHLAVPESLHALIAARIDGLASGRADAGPGRIDPGALVQPGRAEPRSAGHRVRTCSRWSITCSSASLFTVEDDPRSPERGNFRFVQGLLREVAYGTLSRDDRRARHLAAARYLRGAGRRRAVRRAGPALRRRVPRPSRRPREGQAVAVQARVALRGAAQRAADLGSHRDSAGLSRERPVWWSTTRSEELELRTLADSRCDQPAP